jgi:epoxyqueuosine reductase QueG
MPFLTLEHTDFKRQIKEEARRLGFKVVVSKYAYGRDYHDILRKKLKRLMQFIHTRIAPVNGRAFVDSAPILEKAWAVRAGLRWIGKNSLLISPKNGSFCFLGQIIIDFPFQNDSPLPDSRASWTPDAVLLT